MLHLCVCAHAYMYVYAFLLGDLSTSPSLSRATASKELDEQTKKNIPGKNRGKRKADTSSSQDSELEVSELVWFFCTVA